MKKTTFLIILLFYTALLNAQDYQISFTGSGASTTVETVFVENLTQGTTRVLAGSDILHLVGTVGIQSHSNTNENLSIYPNPMQETSKLEFHSEKPDNVKIEVFDMNGKLIANYSGDVSIGINVVDISGFPEGFYTARITTSAWQKTTVFVSLNDAVKSPAIRVGSNTIPDSKVKNSIKSTKSIVEMQYNYGDNLLFKGISGDYARILTIIPTQTQTIDFEFVECTDLDGNNYSVVTIGNQTWMAENLKYLPYVVGPGMGSPAYRFYYVYDYVGTNVTEAKATANYNTYGVLYNWTAALNGSASSAANPSGVQGICPTGWHLPSDAEWTELTDYLGGGIGAGGKLKETGTTHWNSPNTEATNETGFTALPGGFRYPEGTFNQIGNYGYWWSATEPTCTDGWNRAMSYTSNNVFRLNYPKEFGFSIRCVRD